MSVGNGLGKSDGSRGDVEVVVRWGIDRELVTEKQFLDTIEVCPFYHIVQHYVMFLHTFCPLV